MLNCATLRPLSTATVNQQPLEVYMYYAALEREAEARDPLGEGTSVYGGLLRRLTGKNRPKQTERLQATSGEGGGENVAQGNDSKISEKQKLEKEVGGNAQSTIQETEIAIISDEERLNGRLSHTSHINVAHISADDPQPIGLCAPLRGKHAVSSAERGRKGAASTDRMPTQSSLSSQTSSVPVPLPQPWLLWVTAAAFWYIPLSSCWPFLEVRSFGGFTASSIPKSFRSRTTVTLASGSSVDGSAMSATSSSPSNYFLTWQF